MDDLTQWNELMDFLAADPRPSPWISVADRLPEPHIKVLAAFRDGPRIAGLSASSPKPCWFLFGMESWDTGATHWMPLPPPPEIRP